MQGTPKDPGIIPRVAERVMQLIKKREAEEKRELGSLPYHSSWQLGTALLHSFLSTIKLFFFFFSSVAH